MPGEIGARAAQEIEQQCLTRDGNETVERDNVALVEGAERVSLWCECGDPQCRCRVSVTHAEYEGVRAYASHFLICLNHENPENSWVTRENAYFAVIDVVGRTDRSQVQRRNPRYRSLDAQR